MSHSNTRRTGLRAALTCVLAAALAALANCSSSGSSSVAGTAPAGLQKFYQQKLHWAPCSPKEATESGIPAADSPKAVTGFQCATLTVPLDYRHPDGQTIKLAMNRLPAADKTHRVGALLTNPGGPGESGVQFGFAAREFFTSQLRSRYDIVGMDPRGVGLSSPVECKVTAAQQQAATTPVAAAALLGQACQRTSGKIIPYVGTDNAARDMDIARAALGQAKLDYYGASYGTLLGLVYAQMSPRHVGRMVLDSVYSPTAPDDLATQALGFETTFDDMVQTCVARGNCPMGPSRAVIMARFDKLIDQLNAAPVQTGAGEPPLDGDQLVNELAQSLYQEEQWPSVEDGLAALFRSEPAAASKGTRAGRPAAAASGAGTTDQESGSFQAIGCLTMPQDQRTVTAAQQGAQEALAVAPHFGSYVAQEWLNCAKWPVPSPANAGRAISADGTPAILLVNNTYDPATPVTWARSVHGQLANSVLVTNIGGGHVFYPMGSCTHKVVDDFLVSGTKPAPGTACRNRNPAVAP